MIVADTNLLAYLLIAGPQSADAQAAFDRDGDWIAPDVWHHELLNMLATSVRQRLLTADQARDVMAHAPAFVKDAELPWQEVLSLSISTDFATFDCYYVVLARKLDIRLVTADRKLLAHFPDVAISITDFAAGK